MVRHCTLVLSAAEFARARTGGEKTRMFARGTHARTYREQGRQAKQASERASGQGRQAWGDSVIYERRFLVPGPFSLALSIPAIDPTIGKAYSTDTDRINAMPVNFRGRQLSAEVSTPPFFPPRGPEN